MWYALLTGHEALHNSWLFILFFAYVAGITCAILAYIEIVKRSFASRIYLRPVIAAAVTAIANGLIIIALQATSYLIFRAPIRIRFDIINLNVQYGTLIGIGIGIGIEIAEFLIQKLNEHEEEILAEDITPKKIG